MKKIYLSIISLIVTGFSLTSCSDWLDVNPQDQIKEEFLFTTGEGYQTALNGIYRQMATFNLYGSNMTWGIVDAWGQAYCMKKTPTSGAGQAMNKIANLNFTNSQLIPTTDAMWNSAWNAIANCNELIQKTQEAAADTTIFYLGDRERKLILSEAIGLRAMLHFDLLRIYAPAPVTNPGTKGYIPYVDYYPAYVNENKSVSECLEKVIADLKTAQEGLFKYEGEYTTNLSAGQRFELSASGKNLFYVLRGYRLNYWAVTGLLARVYLYAGMKKEAYEQAKILIDEEDKYGFFAAETSQYSGPENIQAGNIKMYEDIMFGLYSPTELTDWDEQINHGSDGSDEYSQYYLSWTGDMVNTYFGDEKNEDWRLKYQFEPKVNGRFYRPLKYKKQSETSTYGPANNKIIPIIRMSEIYYIAAECLYDPANANACAWAKWYLQKVKMGRGIRRPNLDAVSTKEDFLSALISDMRREFVGEGQTLFIYKRLNRILPNPNGEEILPTEANFVLPKPTSESNIK